MAIYRQTTDRLDFETHLKYVSLLGRLSTGLSVACSLTPNLKKGKIENLKNKLQLIELTRRSVSDEHKIVQFDKEYSTASVLWLPIKTYYLTYHLFCSIDYILTGNEASLTTKHYQCMDAFTKMLGNGSLQFSQPLLNQVFDKSILNFKTHSGEHLKANAPDDLVYRLLMKKVAIDKIENYKITNGIPDVRSQKNKDKVERFKNGLTVSIFDFFYLMRLRLNYRNFDFIDDISATNTKKYFEEYCVAAGNLFSCLVNLKNKLIADISVG